jgi:hypothetical protein
MVRVDSLGHQHRGGDNQILDPRVLHRHNDGSADREVPLRSARDGVTNATLDARQGRGVSGVDTAIHESVAVRWRNDRVLRNGYQIARGDRHLGERCERLAQGIRHHLVRINEREPHENDDRRGRQRRKASRCMDTHEGSSAPVRTQARWSTRTR